MGRLLRYKEVETVSMQDELKSNTAEDTLTYGELETMSGFLISLAQAHVFNHFYEELTPKGIRPAQISADMLSLKLAYTTKLIKSFEADGWVKRRQSKVDRRAIQLYLTPEGVSFVDAMTPILAESDAERPSGLTARETQQLMRLLKKYVQLKPYARQKSEDA